MADEAETLYAFSKADSTSLLRIAKGDAAKIGSVNLMPFDASTVYIGFATSTISARSGSTCGTGTVMLKYIDGSNVLQDLQSVNVIHIGLNSIASGASVKVFRVGDKLSAVEVC